MVVESVTPLIVEPAVEEVALRMGVGPCEAVVRECIPRRARKL
jgi:hypothetical protein